MTHGSLFSGIGGFDLAAEWMGWENKFHCEWNEFGQRVLHHYWPDAELFTDITKSNFTKYANTIDILTGGFPCQPYSAAGKRMGKEDERHLWPEMCRAIKEITPRWVVGENVRGLTNWNGGLVFDEVCTDLENLGYQVAPYLIPACATNAPHKRERIWFVAYCNSASAKYKIQTRGNVFTSQSNYGIASDTDNVRLQYSEKTGNMGKSKTKTQRKRCQFAKSIETNGGNGNASDTCNARLQGSEFNGTFNRGKQHSNEPHDSITQLHQIPHWQNFPTQSPVCGRDDGLPTELDGITFSKWRNESIRAYGNAVVPNVVYQIFKAIEAYEIHEQSGAFELRV